MKNLSRIFVLLSLTSLVSTPVSLRAQDAPPPPDQGGQGDQGASFQTFYDQLGSQGTWVQTDDYGYVFQPNVSDPNWAPYTNGHWVYTDQGWAWDSDESWGWATYHYGRWANIDGTGWVWVPGYRWAPAWVSWRYGGGYAGWAPLPPETFIGAEYRGGGGVNVEAGFHFGSDVDVNFNIGPGCYSFVSVGDLGEPNYGGRYLDRSRNYTVINRTTNVTNINVTNNYYGNSSGGNFRGVSTGGPRIDEVNSHTRTHLETVHLAEANQPGRGNLQGKSFAVYAPRVNAASLHTAKPNAVGNTISHPTFNRGDTITRPMAATASLKPAAPSAEAIAAAKDARMRAPATAKIATEKTQIKSPMTKPLTSMAPVEGTHATTSAAKPAAANAEHPTGDSAFTGGQQKPAETYHPEGTPATTYHPQTEEKPATTYHPQTEEKPASTYHPQTEEKPASTFHPQTEEKPASTYHPQTEEKPASTYHPQTEEKTAPANHPQAQEHHDTGEANHPKEASGAKPAPNGNKAGGKKDQQGN